MVVKEREEESLWCKDIPLTSSSFPECFFIDSKGLVFERAPDFSDDVYMRYFGVLATSTDPIGQYFLPEKYPAMNAFVSAIRDNSIFRPRSVIVKDDGDIEMVVARGRKL